MSCEAQLSQHQVLDNVQIKYDHQGAPHSGRMSHKVLSDLPQLSHCTHWQAL